MATIIELGQKVKAKYPQYADMSDLEVGQKVKAKYPDAYDSFIDVVPPTLGSYQTKQTPEQQKVEALKQNAATLGNQASQAKKNAGVLNTLESVAASSEKGLGETIGKIEAVSAANKYTLPGVQSSVDQLLKSRKIIADNKAKGVDTTKSEEAYNKVLSNLKLNEDQIKQSGLELPTTGQVVGQLGGIALDALSAGTYGKAASAMKTGELVTKTAPAIVSTVSKSAEGFIPKAVKVVLPTATGYAADVTQGLQGSRGENRTGAKAFIPGVGTAIGLGTGLLSTGAEGVSNAVQNLKSKSQPIQDAEKAFQEIKPKYTQKELITLARDNPGLVTSDAKGNYIYKPTAEDLRVSKVAADLITPNSNTAQRINKVESAIKNVSENDVVPILRSSQSNGSLDDIYKYIDQIEPTKQFSKKINPSAYEAFGIVKNDAKKEISNAIKAEVKSDPNINFNEAVWKSRQKIDDIINDQFGATAFEDPLKNSAREGATKARAAIQRFLVDSVSGKDMELMAKAREFANTSLKKGIEVPNGQDYEGMVEGIYKQLGGSQPTNTLGKDFADKMSHIHDLYTIKDNYLIPRAVKENPTGITRWMKAHPKTTTIAKYGLAAGAYEAAKKYGVPLP